MAQRLGHCSIAGDPIALPFPTGMAVDRWPLARDFRAGARQFSPAAGTIRGRCFTDVVDVDHQPGSTDASLRPNQILAVGGLPLVLIDPEHARSVVDSVEKQLWTPLGLRTANARANPAMPSSYRGGPRERDAAYHQGTVWPWLAGPFVEAWLRVAGNTRQARHEARGRFLAPAQRTIGAGRVLAISAKSPTLSRRTRRADAHFKPGVWAS